MSTQTTAPTSSELSLLDCIVGMMVQAGVIDDDDLVYNQGLSAYEHAESVLDDYGLLIEVHWRSCGILTRKDPCGRYPGTYFEAHKFNKMKQFEEVAL